MLLHNGGYQQQGYVSYTDQTYSSHYQMMSSDGYFGMYRTPSTTSIPTQHSYVYSDIDAPPTPPVQSCPSSPLIYGSPSTPPIYGCPCPSTPPQQSFLHQILTGKGYKNSIMGTNINSAKTLNKTGSRYSSSCCFGNSVRPSGYSCIQHSS